MRFSLFTPIFIILILFSTACSRSKNVKEDSTLTELNRTISLLSKDKSCDDINQCKSIAYGDKPCGGPYSYLIYSSKNTDSVKLLEKVKLYNKLERETNIKNNAVSNCMMILPPILVCNITQCDIAR